MYPPGTSRRSGFTLIELLVVIAIIAVLAAISTPVIQGAMGGSKAAACLLNLRQIGSATMAYAADHNTQLPPAGTGGTPQWALAIAPYIGGDPKNKKSIFVCPDCAVPVQSAKGNEVAVTYGMHYGLMPKGGPSLRLHSIVRPQEVILAADMCQNPGNRGWSPYSIEKPDIFKGGGRTGTDGLDLDTPIGTSPDADTGNSQSIRYRHNGRANVVMVDGHAQAMPKGEILNRNVIYNR
jgi:prepilin-type N-terminal cleavage/methylation domain-containing protein/prepilin-type processing-associated H-X9-DG protein